MNRLRTPGPVRATQLIQLIVTVLLLYGAPVQRSLAEAQVPDQIKNQAQNQALTLEAAVTQALHNNPNLAQMQARYLALKQIPAQQATLPDPVLSINAMNLPTNSFHVGQEAMTQMQLGISQVLPFPGKLALREQASELTAQAAGFSVDEARIGLISGVSNGWWQLVYLDRALAVVTSNQALLRNLVQVARTKYEVADGLQQDVLLAQLELSKLINQKIQLQAVRDRQAVALNLLMDSPADATVTLPATVNEQLPTLAPQTVLYERALRQRPLLQQLTSQIDSAQSRLALAKKDYYPDFKLGVLYGDRQGANPVGVDRPDLLSVMFSVTLPLHTATRQSRAVKQRTYEVSKNRYAFEDQQGQVMAEISRAVIDYQQAGQQVALFKRGIIPQAQQTLASMRAGYQVNEVDFLNLVGSQITLFNYELSYWMALTQANQALARLAAAVGEENIYE